jgi:methyl-accepting chemotaxis protein
MRESGNLERAAQDINNFMNDMVGGVREVNVAVNEINELMIKNREAADTLMREVQKFKIE